MVHDSARPGAQALPGIGFTSASWSTYSMRNGVMTPGVSAGSNHVGASVTVTARVTCPAGPSDFAGVWANSGHANATVTTSATAGTSDERRAIAVLRDQTGVELLTVNPA